MPLFALLLALAQQQPDTFVTDSLARPIPANRPSYVVRAMLDEERHKLVAGAIVRYVNARSDTLRAIYVHQYLNAFRPGSKWSAVDQREGRVRFQRLRDPDHGYERFTAPVLVNGREARVEYPGAPDSTVARIVLDSPILPGDTATIVTEWEARPSTVLRRQGRRGRSWDFAQWFPKIAVIDNGGWEPNALVPSGEFYGDFGDFDVTLLVRDDQVVGATGVVISGDPGWTRAARFGRPYLSATDSRPAPETPPGPVPLVIPAGYKAVRFQAADVHHFAFSVSPDYRYEGGVYVRRSPAGTARGSADTVALHVLYRPGDEGEWGEGQALARTRVALEWLEHIYGPYLWPQLTNLHRLEGGGTEFPMLMMNGSGSQGLILHEGGHMYAQGMLANNEWRSGWMDEGLTSYQTRWAQGATPQDRATRGGRDSVAARVGYRRLAPRQSSTDARQIQQVGYDLLGIAQPIGTLPDNSREFGVYTAMTYTRAELMFGALRDAIGDSAFTAFLRGYYRDWRLRHVDERAMRASAERAHGRPLGWFFDQWVRATGLTDYALKRVHTSRSPDGGWVTRGLVRRRGEYAHPMPLGVLTSAGWTIARGDPLAGEQWVEVRTSERPRAVRLDPLRTTEDWDRRNDVAPRSLGDALRLRSHPRAERTSRIVFDFPFLDQGSRDHDVLAVTPLLWYGRAEGPVLAARMRSNYLGIVDRTEVGFARGLGRPRPGGDAVPMEPFQFWLRMDSPRLFGARPLMGARLATFSLDGVAGIEVGRAWDASRHHFAQTRRIARDVALSVTTPTGNGYLPARWEDATVAELRAVQEIRDLRGPWRTSLVANAAAGWVDRRFGTDGKGDYYTRGELWMDFLRYGAEERLATFLRLYGGLASPETPRQRGVHLSARDPYQTFWSHWQRPAGGPLSPDHAPYVPLGGAGLRGYSPAVRSRIIYAANAEQGVRLAVVKRTPRPLALWASLFGDVGLETPVGSSNHRLVADAGVGVSLRGSLYDRDVRLRVDAPVYVETLGQAARHVRGRRLAPRIQFSLNDLW